MSDSIRSYRDLMARNDEIAETHERNVSVDDETAADRAAFYGIDA